MYISLSTIGSLSFETLLSTNQDTVLEARTRNKPLLDQAEVAKQRGGEAFSCKQFNGTPHTLVKLPVKCEISVDD